MLSLGVDTAAEGDESIAADTTIHMANPAATYCSDLGFQYQMADGASGQQGSCIFPDGKKCGEWEFLQGTCGAEHSYCEQHGYGIETLTDGNDPFSREYAVCVSESGQEVGSVTQLTRLVEKTRSGGCTDEEDSSAAVAAPKPSLTAPTAAATAAVPSGFDWRNQQGQNWMTPIKNQGQCGSCWAFAAVGAVEAAHNIDAQNAGLDLDLSEQYLVSDCSDAGSCCGGWTGGALAFIQSNGVPDEACMAYVDGSGCSCPSSGCSSGCAYRGGGSCSDRSCGNRCSNWSSRLTQIGATGSVPTDRASIKQYLVERGPLTASIAWTNYGYWDGDIYRCTHDSGINHAVVLVGYDDPGGYWIVRNSWGTTWGDGGYFKMGYGECSVETYPRYVRVETPSTRNDNFAKATVLRNLPIHRSQATDGATVQAGEPQPCGSIGSTVWFRYTPGSATSVTIDSSGSSYDTVLAAYRGNSLSNLTAVACNDDFQDRWSRLDLAAAAGVTYWIQAGGYNGDSGTLDLNVIESTPERPGRPLDLTATPGSRQVTLAWNPPASTGSAPITDYQTRYRETGTTAWHLFADGVSTDTTMTVTGLTNRTSYQFAVRARSAAGAGAWSDKARATPRSGPANDSFASAVRLSGPSGSVHGSNVNATIQSGEPSHHGNASHSVWWKWTAPQSGTATIDTEGSGFDTVLAVYTGGSLGSLTEVSYDDDGGSGLTSRVQLEVTAGRTYRIVVDGYSDRTGNITLNWSLGATQTDPASSAPTPT
ncbi:MAG: DUF333 domain-containing protein [Actinobacteria bacterium]|nr:DUF333 domain-containing protein [Actinomycetota bacterium]